MSPGNSLTWIHSERFSSLGNRVRLWVADRVVFDGFVPRVLASAELFQSGWHLEALSDSLTRSFLLFAADGEL